MKKCKSLKETQHEYFPGAFDQIDKKDYVTSPPNTLQNFIFAAIVLTENNVCVWLQSARRNDKELLEFSSEIQKSYSYYGKKLSLGSKWT
ncbi:MAG: hypothetical protein EZS28_009120 [Streblomastix strix]|uniref:Uncharacterized protein n=1 Tax=Streblomastix strix TaxID=222440 RepID=A0A5J4WKK8_9EUKA|nr:MAG: hypothetical protein EZS28_009120 [Streblomastix strix]